MPCGIRLMELLWTAGLVPKAQLGPWQGVREPHRSKGHLKAPRDYFTTWHNHIVQDGRDS